MNEQSTLALSKLVFVDTSNVHLTLKLFINDQNLVEDA